MNKRLLNILFILSMCIMFAPIAKASNVVSSVTSPNGELKVELSLIDGELSYRTFYKSEELISPSKLGIALVSSDFSKRLTFVSADEQSNNQTYELPSGKKSIYTDNYTELTSKFSRTLTNGHLDVVFRVYNDGFAFKYVVDGVGMGTLNSEISEVVCSGFDLSWVQKYHKDYSWYYDARNWAGNLAEREFNTPALIKSGDRYILLTEAANYGNYSASKLIANQEVGKYTFQPVGAISSPFPFETPWRAMMVGHLPTIIESTMIENLNPETDIADFSWIKPGRTSWDWGGEDASNTVGFSIAKRYIDYASEMGWEYFTLDDGWDGRSADYTLAEIVDYAKSKNVGVIVWSHQNRFRNDKDDMYQKMKVWADLGVKGVKADFWEDDSQQMMQKYDKFMEVTAELKLLVNLHGCTKPSGTRRKYPHLLTTEAVLGGEFYIQANPEMVHATHNLNLTMTRNVIGAMDYTPCDFALKSGRIQKTTSWAHQLALTVAYESGIQYLIDRPENYRYHIAESFLRRLPVAWDDIKSIEAEPDLYSTIARRTGDDWYVATLASKSRTLNLTLDFLDAGKTYNAYVYKDGECKSEIIFDYIENLSAQSTISLLVAESGGATIHLSTSTDYVKPSVQKYEAESKDNRTFGTKHDDPDGLCSGGKYVGTIGRGNYLKFQKIEAEEDGEYAMTVYFMTGEERSSYINVNDEVAPLFYNFNNSKGYAGNNLAYTTIIVSLKKGMNTIEFGNKDAYCPNFDRITIKRLIDSSTVSIQETSLANQLKITTQADQLRIDSDQKGSYTVYDLHGRIIGQQQLEVGENRFSINGKGIYIVNVNVGIESYSSKFILK